jgi:prepilin-type N-terminal cleavage/methylation domain-containing protein
MAIRRLCACFPAGSRTCTSDGFTLTEMVVALALSIIIVSTVCSLWIGFVARNVDTQERLVSLQRWRVVTARLERDLRLATAEGLADRACAPILEATSGRVTLVTRSIDGAGIEIVAWEIIGGALMRRRSPLPSDGSSPAVGVFVDSKTMLEGLRSGSFRYGSGAAVLEIAPQSDVLSRIDTIELRCSIGVGLQGGGDNVAIVGLVGR